jgi:hypothetical protein
MRFGPITAPNVVAQTTIERSLALGRPSGKSVAANLAWSETADPAPKRKSATSSTGNDLQSAANIMPMAPRIAKPAPKASATLRPLAKARFASGIAEKALPRVLNVAAAPDQAVLPESSTAMMAPTERVAPRPNPPSACPEARTLTVFRWSPSRSISFIGVTPTI